MKNVAALLLSVFWCLPILAQHPLQPLANPSYAITAAASDISSTAAQLNGIVNADSIATRVFFDWGTSPAYGNSSAIPGDSLRDNIDVDVSLMLNGLTPGTTYHFRVRGISVNGDTLRGENRSFDTNSNPEVQNAIGNQFFDLGDPPQIINLNTVFDDPDGDPLNYSATSGNPAAVLAAISGGSNLMLRPLGPGSSLITVTATDGRGGTASDVFTATVAGNQPPQVLNALPDTSMLRTNPPLVFDLQALQVFDDPDGDPLSYNAGSANSNIAIAAISDDASLVVSAVNSGTTNIITAASDGRGGIVSDTFAITVLINGPPTVQNPIGDQVMRVDETRRFALEGGAAVFDDPDGDPLTYSAQSGNGAIAAAGIVGASLDSLEVTLLNDGTATITVNADDGRGGRVAEVFTVSSNAAPRVVPPGLPESLTILEDSIFFLDLRSPEIFSDPDNDSLIFSAESDNGDAALASISQNRFLTISAIDGGRSAIIVSAADGRMGVARDTINVLVNNPPTYDNQIPQPQWVTVNRPPLKIALRDFFSDEDEQDSPGEDSLIFSAISDNNAIIGTALNGDTLLLSAVGDSCPTAEACEARITITADDTRNARVVATFSARLNLPPQANCQRLPVLQPLTIGGNAFIINLVETGNAVFDDPDGDEVVFSVSSSDTTRAVPLVSGVQLIVVAGTEAGAATIFLQGSDRKGGIDSCSFAVDTRNNFAPQIRLDTDNTSAMGEAGQLFNVQAIVTKVENDVDITSVRTFYRAGDASQLDSLTMANLDSTFFATVSGDAVTSRGFLYFLEARDELNTRSRLLDNGVPFSIPVRIPGGLEKTSPQPAGSAANGYRLISFPLAIDNPAPQAIFQDELGDYDDTRWRFLATGPGGIAVDFPQIHAVQTGHSYWLLTLEGATINSGPGAVLPIAREHSIVLHEGWNTIGNPFNFELPLENIALRTTGGDTLGGSELTLRSYNGNWNNPVTDAVATLLPFEGYALFVESNLPAARLYYNPNRQALPAQKVAASSVANDWQVIVEAHLGEARDVDNVFGVNALAATERDGFDYREPPGVGDFLQVYFTLPQGSRNAPAGKFATDIRAPLTNGSEWQMYVESAASGVVNLDFNGISGLPADLEIWLIDPLTGERQNLREAPRRRISVHAGAPARNLRILVGTADYISSSLAGSPFAPMAYQLQQNFPNPFNPVTTIRYSLPVEGTVTLMIYNLLGQEVVRLLDKRRMEAGYHSIIWDGRDAAGGQLPSGIYFYRLQSGNFSDVRKMLLLE